MYVIGVHNSYSKAKFIGKGVYVDSNISEMLKKWYYGLTKHHLYIKDFK